MSALDPWLRRPPNSLFSTVMTHAGADGRWLKLDECDKFLFFKFRCVMNLGFHFTGCLTGQVSQFSQLFEEDQLKTIMLDIFK